MFTHAFIDKDNVMFVDDFMLAWTFNNYDELNNEEIKIFENKFRKHAESVGRCCKIEKN